MEIHQIITLLRDRYQLHAVKLELVRDSGSMAYAVFTESRMFFLRIVKGAFVKTAVTAVEIQEYLYDMHFPVPQIVRTAEGSLYIEMDTPDESRLFILYEYLEGGEPDRETDMEEIGALTGRLHTVMQSCPCALVAHDKYFFIDRYIGLLTKMDYPEGKVEAFQQHGDMLWNRVKDLPPGYCHGDLYIGNIFKAKSEKLYILDFDTSCFAFPIYDVALVCNGADYFTFDEKGVAKTHEYMGRFMKGYSQYRTVGRDEAEAVYDLLAVYHYQLQATILEVYGLTCVDHPFLDRQFEWLMLWEKLTATLHAKGF